MNYVISHHGVTLQYDPVCLHCTVQTPRTVWEWGKKPSLILQDGTEISFDRAHCESEVKKTGVADGVTAVYSQFPGAEAVTVFTFVWMSPDTEEVHFEFRVEGDKPLQIGQVRFPAPFSFNETDGYTVLPRMQGTLIPAGETVSIIDGRLQDLDGFMCFFGQVRKESGYVAIYETPYDAHYGLPGDDTVMPYFIASMGTMRYKRSMRYRFFDGDCSYVTLAKSYRQYVKETGRFVSLTEKAAKNPNVKKLFGTPIIHEGIAVHMSPESAYYQKDKPEENDYFTPFAVRARQLRELKAKGLTSAYLHLDGWGRHGYDNLHPDPFPPHEESGGAQGMKELSDTCRELGYVFGIHDQYRDYYYDAPSFDLNNAILNADGSHPYCTIWPGGAHSWLCTALAPAYVKRNYDEFERLGIRIEGAYLDVFTAVAPDECYDPDHPMTREQCAAYRRQCFEILSARGIIPSSEQVIDSVLPAIALCHHAPYFTKKLGAVDSEPVGIPIPLFNLVYHDAVIIPWSGTPGSHGQWGIPGNDCGFLHAILNGGAVYCPIDADEKLIKELTPAIALQKRVAALEMVSHSFADGNIRRQKTVFADGTSVEVDFDSDTYTVTYPD